MKNLSPLKTDFAIIYAVKSVKCISDTSRPVTLFDAVNSTFQNDLDQQLGCTDYNQVCTIKMTSFNFAESEYETDYESDCPWEAEESSEGYEGRKTKFSGQDESSESECEFKGFDLVDTRTHESKPSTGTLSERKRGTKAQAGKGRGKGKGSPAINLVSPDEKTATTKFNKTPNATSTESNKEKKGAQTENLVKGRGKTMSTRRRASKKASKLAKALEEEKNSNAGAEKLSNVPDEPKNEDACLSAFKEGLQTQDLAHDDRASDGVTDDEEGRPPSPILSGTAQTTTTLREPMFPVKEFPVIPYVSAAKSAAVLGLEPLFTLKPDKKSSSGVKGMRGSLVQDLSESTPRKVRRKFHPEGSLLMPEVTAEPKSTEKVSTELPLLAEGSENDQVVDKLLDFSYNMSEVSSGEPSNDPHRGRVVSIVDNPQRANDIVSLYIRNRKAGEDVDIVELARVFDYFSI